MAEDDHEQLADDLEEQTDKLAEENKRLEHEVGEVRSDWERKRRDANVPGADPPDVDEGETPEEAPPAKQDE